MSNVVVYPIFVHNSTKPAKLNQQYKEAEIAQPQNPDDLYNYSVILIKAVQDKEETFIAKLLIVKNSAKPIEIIKKYAANEFKELANFVTMPNRLFNCEKDILLFPYEPMAPEKIDSFINLWNTQRQTSN